jgi:hypothetical protein
MNCLRYAHEAGAPWDEWTCAYASMNGRLDCLRYAHEAGAPWDRWTCAYAAQNGHLDCLRYAHEAGAPWDGWTCAYAAQNGRLDCLRYAHEAGAPWPKSVSDYSGHKPDRSATIVRLVAERRRHYAAKVVQHEWRRFAELQRFRRGRAVRRIEAAVVDWLLRPGGSASRAAAARFAVLSRSQ